MNIAIVDEEKIELETAEIFLRCYIKKFWSQYESSIHIEIFQSAEDFIQFFCAGLYHLVILGNHMEKTANFIRACGDYDTKIIFLKNNDDFKNEGGDYECCCYRRQNFQITCRRKLCARNFAFR